MGAASLILLGWEDEVVRDGMMSYGEDPIEPRLVEFLEWASSWSKGAGWRARSRDCKQPPAPKTKRSRGEDASSHGLAERGTGRLYRQQVKSGMPAECRVQQG